MSQAAKNTTPDITPNSEQNSSDSNGFPYRVPEHFLQQIDHSNPQDPLLKQVKPSRLEEVTTLGFSKDPVEDLDSNPIPSLIHKYHGRVLLIASPKCDIHCRYCFRRHFPYSEQSNLRHWQKAIEYIKTNQSVHEVILSGGDPMALGEKVLVKLINQVESIAHVKTLRIHSRTPVAAPDKAPFQAFVSWAQQSKLNKVLVVHCNHPNELSDQTQKLFTSYKQAGITLLNQSVLLKEVNDSIDILEALSHKLFSQGVLPYYLNQLDRVQGSAHFEVDDETAIELHNKLKRRLAGYLVPKLVKDIPNQGSKTALC
jgi:EF-P beta-lysylation protein EpmB